MITVSKKSNGTQFVPNIPEGSIFSKCYLNSDGETYTVEGLTMWGNSPYTISQLQGMLLLDRMGILAQVEEMVEASGTPAKIYWKTAQNWERTSPILNNLAPLIWPEDTQAKLDQFFIEAKKLN